jgi:hypothetical protein
MNFQQKHILPVLLLACGAWADEPHLFCNPQQLRGLPGEPLRAELTVETDRVPAIQLRIPAVSNLVLRTVEKVPVQRTAAGRFVQKRIIIWQGIEAGSATLTNLTVQLDDVTLLFPNLGITVDRVVPAAPPNNPPRPAATPPLEGNETSSLHNPLLRKGAGTAGWVLRFPEVAT